MTAPSPPAAGSIVEKVVCALCDASKVDPNEFLNDVGVVRSKAYEKHAKAAIRAVLDAIEQPSEGMLYERAKLDLFDPPETLEDFVRLCPGFIEDETRYWRAMIAAFRMEIEKQ